MTRRPYRYGDQPLFDEDGPCDQIGFQFQETDAPSDSSTNVPDVLKPMPATLQRLSDSAKSISSSPPDTLDWLHSALTQCPLPYRDPGDRVYEFQNGRISMRLEAGSEKDPASGRWQELGLPYGPKPRLIMIYLAGEALRTNSRNVNVGASMTAFVTAIEGRRPNGQTIKPYKEQLRRLRTTTFRVAYEAEENRLPHVNGQLIKGFDLFFPAERGQKIPWDSTITLDNDYFASLQEHAVPLDRRAIAALRHNALALDIYTWLAQRLHRVPDRGVMLSWANLHAQFGRGYKDRKPFKRAFKTALFEAQCVYPAAAIEAVIGGFRLRTSPPPVQKLKLLVPAGGPKRAGLRKT